MRFIHCFKRLFLIILFSSFLSLQPMEIAIPIGQTIIQVTQQYAPLIATALGKYIINYHFGSYIFMYDMQKWVCSSAGITSQQALSLLNQSYATKQLFDRAMQGKTFLPEMVQAGLNSSSAVSLVQPAEKIASQAIPLMPVAANSAMLSVLKSHLMQLAVKTKFALHEQPMVSSGALSPSSFSVSVGYGPPDATLTQVRMTERLNAEYQNTMMAAERQAWLDFYVRYKTDPLFKQQVIQAQNSLAHLLVKATALSDTPEIISVQRTLAKQMGPYIESSWWQNHWQGISRILYYPEGIFKGINTIAEQQQALIVFGKCLRELIPSEAEFSRFLQPYNSSPSLKNIMGKLQGNTSWPEAVQEVAHSIKDLFVSSPEISEIMIQGAGFNQLLDTLLAAGFEADIAKVEAIYGNFEANLSKEYTSLTSSQMDQLQKIYQYFRGQHYNEDGISYYLTKNPYWNSLKNELEQARGTDQYIAKQQSATRILNQQYAQVHELLHQWGFEMGQVPAVFEEFAYKLIHQEISNWASVIESECIANSALSPYLKRFYHSNGLVKGLEYKNQLLSGAKIPSAILDINGSQLRLLLNRCAHIPITHPFIQSQLEKCLEMIKNACEDVQGKVYNACLQRAKTILTHLPQFLNEHGIPLHFMYDPLFKHIEEDMNAKMDIPLSEVQAIKNALVLRFMHTNGFLEQAGLTWEKAPADLITIYYDLSAIKPEKWAEFVELKCKHMPSLESLKQYLYSRNGLFKGIPYKGNLMQQLQMPSCILDVAHTQERILLNRFAMLYGGSENLTAQAIKGIDALCRACQTTTTELQTVFRTHADNILHACSNIAADQRILLYQTSRPLSLTAAGSQLYNQAMTAIADAGSKIRELETQQGVSVIVGRAYYSLIFDNAAQAIDHLSCGLIEDAQRRLERGPALSLTTLKTIAQELNKAGKGFNLANLEEYLQKNPTVASTIGATSLFAYSLAKAYGRAQPSKNSAIPVQNSSIVAEEQTALAQDAQLPEQPNNLLPAPSDPPSAAPEPPDEKEKEKHKVKIKISESDIKRILEIVRAKKQRLQEEGFTIEELMEGIRNLQEDPEFLEGLQRLLDNLLNEGAESSGFWYEFQLLHRMRQQGIKVLGWGKKVLGQFRRYEFDILTENKLIECKNLRWEKMSPVDIQKRVLRLIEKLHVAKNNNKEFALYSRYKVPESVRTKLMKYGIEIFEGLL